MGGEIEYTCLGNNDYRVRVSLYRDCLGTDINPYTSYQIIFPNLCGSPIIRQAQLLSGFPVSITPLCSNETDACENPNVGVVGVEEFIFEDIVNIPLTDNCQEFTLIAEDCCRNNAISTVANSGTEGYSYYTQNLGGADLCNNSPIFNNEPTAFFCVGQEVNYNHGVTDPDGDQLVFSLINCLDDDGLSVNYISPYDGNTPLDANDLVLDASTGAISFTPNALQVGILCVLVEEFRDGIKIGETTRDMQFTVLECTQDTIAQDANILPVISGFDGQANSSGVTGDYEAEVCYNIPFCFTLTGFDDDFDLVELSWNEGIPDASFTINNNNSLNPTVDFCWTPTFEDIGVNFFTLTVKDDACDIRGINTYTFKIEVSEGLIDFNYTENPATCFNTPDGSASVNIITPLANPNIEWQTTPPQFGLNANNLLPGTYDIIIQDQNLDCSFTTIQIEISSPNEILITEASPISHASCYGFSDGTIEINITEGITPYDIIWSNGFTGTNNTNLEAGIYTVTVTDANTCVQTASFEVMSPSEIIDNANLSDYNGYQVNCANGSDGFIELNPQGGSGLFTYTWPDNTSSSSIYDLAPGSYIVTVTDEQNCSQTFSYNLISPTTVFSQVSQTGVTCYGDNDGSLVIENISGGIGPYYWSFDSDEFNIIDSFPYEVNGLFGGEQVMYFQDDNQCIFTDTVDVYSPPPLVIDIFPADTLIELGEMVELSFTTTAQGTFDFEWTSSPGYQVTCDSCFVLDSIMPFDNVEFYIDLVEIEKGCTGKGKAVVRVREEDFIYIPNAFSPNNDGQNDFFTVYGQENVIAEIESFSIFDRWGNMVFLNENFLPNQNEEGWDGFVQGDKAPPAVYIYKAEIKYINGKTKIFHGDLTLLR